LSLLYLFIYFTPSRSLWAQLVPLIHNSFISLSTSYYSRVFAHFLLLLPFLRVRWPEVFRYPRQRKQVIWIHKLMYQI
jgi:hypothetical protein